MAEKPKKKWLRARHRIITGIGRPVLYLVCKILYPGLKLERFKDQGKRPYLILLNHQTPFDQFFVACSFRSAVYYLATEDIFSLGWVSSLIRWVVAPIPIKKQTMDITAVKNCILVAREGGTICIAPEGNRTYSGRTEYMRPSIASLAKKLGLPIALYRIEGGYGAEPRWTDARRRGPIRAYVCRVIEPEEVAALSADELFREIEQGLAVDETKLGGTYRSEQRAEFLDRCIYICPTCGFAAHYAEGNTITCSCCKKVVTYGEDKRLTGADFPFAYAAEWYDYQKEYINSRDLTALTEKPVFVDRAELREVILNQHKNVLRENAELKLYGDRVVFDEGTENELVLPFSALSAVSVLGRNKANIYHEGTVYQLKGDKHFNALKYVHFYYRHKNITRGEENGEFLGL